MKYRQNRIYFWGFIMLIAIIASYFTKNNRGKTPSVARQEIVEDLAQIYETQPDFETCQEGIIAESEKQKVLERVNFIRSLHKLPPVRYSRNDSNAAKAALISAVNDELDPSRVAIDVPKCWSDEGEDGLIGSIGFFVFATKPRLTSAWVKSEYFVDAIVQDPRREGLGRRELLLSPALSSISFGRADGSPTYSDTSVSTYEGEEVQTSVTQVSSAIFQVFSDGEINPSKTLDFIAYPYQDYPTELFKKDGYAKGYPSMSLSAIADPENANDEQKVDFSHATIEIIDENKQSIAVHSIQTEPSNISAGDVLAWKVDELKRNRLYDVKIQNVKVGDREQNYAYWFKLK